ncbi:MAG: PEP-CTERM sorting domain-containing protein [Proteobacteria bacterium]|nr:PEP-CTERM sorting domain-containing protein [Pseudomonadota bacterium]
MNKSITNIKKLAWIVYLFSLLSSVQQAYAGIVIYGCGTNATDCTLAELEQGGYFFINDMLFTHFSHIGQLDPANVTVTPVRYDIGSGITSAFYIGLKMSFYPSLSLASSGSDLQASFDTGYEVFGSSYLDNPRSQLFIGANTGLGNIADYRAFLFTLPLDISVVCSDVGSCPYTSPVSNVSTFLSSPPSSFSVFNYLDVRGPAEVTGFETIFQVVPEPATIALISAGLLGMVFGKRRNAVRRNSGTPHIAQNE